jgi:hypothetical protein
MFFGLESRGEVATNTVIASGAKQSIAPQAEKWIASAFALGATADKSSLTLLAMTL